MDNQRNIITAVLLTALILFGWDAAMQYFYPNAYKPKPVASAPATPGAQPSLPGEGSLPGAGAIKPADLKVALASPGRVPIAAPGLSGSINTVGALVDDLSTNRHTKTLKSADGFARVFSPMGTPTQQFAKFGWAGAAATVPNATTQWIVPAGAKLTPTTPVTLSWNNAGGQTFAIRYAVDADYMLTVTQTVTNGAAVPISLQPVAQINRTNKNADVSTFNVHSGPIGAFDKVVNFDYDYDDVLEVGTVKNTGKADWLGFTDIYWMSLLIPDKAETTSDYRAMGGGIYLANLFYANSIVPPGQQLTRTTRVFAGAKESAVLDKYEEAGIPNFGFSIDWGWFWWFAKPMFALLMWLFNFAGNFGVAIILLTLIVRGVMFPIAQKQFASMAAMRAIMPKQKALQERYKDDKQKLQQETMALYKQEGVNPLAGCLPIFLQIPIFFALYKVLILAIEMRHQPFVGWIKDLSAQDPMMVLNLFGLLPFTPPSLLSIGLLAILLGVTMWLQFKLNPPPPDPIQQQMFAIMPWMMMFVMAPFAAGLLIYWITSNILTIAQQKYLYSRHPQLKEQAAKEAEDAKRALAQDKA